MRISSRTKLSTADSQFLQSLRARISLTTVLFSVLIGAVLPLFGILKLAPAVAVRLGPTPAIGISPSTLAIAACYALAGIILGSSAEAQSYVWVMLITYVPAHLLGGSTWLVSLQHPGLRDQLFRVSG